MLRSCEKTQKGAIWHLQVASRKVNLLGLANVHRQECPSTKLRASLCHRVFSHLPRMNGGPALRHPHRPGCGGATAGTIYRAPTKRTPAKWPHCKRPRHGAKNLLFLKVKQQQIPQASRQDRDEFRPELHGQIGALPGETNRDVRGAEARALQKTADKEPGSRQGRDKFRPASTKAG